MSTLAAVAAAIATTTTTPSSSTTTATTTTTTKAFLPMERTPAKNTTPTKNSPFLDGSFVNLASASAKSRILFATDEWFATAENLIQDGPPIFTPDLYCEQGKVMDGWETRRRRDAGHDWCVIELGTGSEAGAQVYGIEVDTAHFTGNQAPRISLEVADCHCKAVDSVDGVEERDDSFFSWMPGSVKRLVQGGGVQGTGQSLESISQAKKACDQFQWTEILPMTNLGPGYEETRMHYFLIPDHIRTQAGEHVTHLKVNYYPDGGVARLRLWGRPTLTRASSTPSLLSNSSSSSSLSNPQSCHNATGDTEPPSSKPYPHPELSLSTNGGRGLVCSNKHYGVPSNLIQPTYGKDMGDGWETARHPDRPAVLVKDPVTNLVDSPLLDWAVLKLGMGGASEIGGVTRIIVDTKHFRGNYPESVQIEGCCVTNVNADEMVCSFTPTNDSVHTTPIQWFPLLPRTKMGPDNEHVFDRELGHLLNAQRGVTHVRVCIYPDGGLSRVRVYGHPAFASVTSSSPC